MKLMFASDIHGSALWCEKLISEYHSERPDKLLLLGDILYHGPRNDLPDKYDPKSVCMMLNELKGNVFGVRGNCDSEVDQMVLNFTMMSDYAIVFADGITMYLTHGHKGGPLMRAGDVLLCGHTHIPRAEILSPVSKVHSLNAGSVALPKENTPHSFIIYENRTFIFKKIGGGEFLRYNV